MEKTFLAFDLGASSGRAIIGKISDEKVEISEIHRFPNGPLEKDGALYWDIEKLFYELKTGLRKALKTVSNISGVGIDTWGVDYAIVKPNGKLARNPYHYRDKRTEGAEKKVYELISPDELYRKTGIQFMILNTIFQLYVHKQMHPEDMDGTVLMMPDALSYLFTGKVSCEYTNASTTGILNAIKKNWDQDIITKLSLPKTLFPNISQPCSSAGNLSCEIRKELDCENIPFFHVGSHDTASAVAAVPSIGNEHFAYISCGTWALLGTEIDKPLLNEESQRANYTNEGGLNGKIRFLTNITGLWLLQECKRIWDSEGKKYSYSQMVEMGEKAEPLKYLINPSNNIFLSPCNMPDLIKKYCYESGQGMIKDDHSIIRCVLDSLGMCFRVKILELEKICRTKFEKIHIIGGGCQNRLLMQNAADLMEKEVIAGPVEATAIGNIIAQGMASGIISSLQQGRKIISQSFPLDTFKPSHNISRDFLKNKEDFFRKLK
ncbi:MAG TPA: rhamnulokinase family protein [Victivallales bacterium]|nr:rhamnulokinase family protein [Victivallales bacterium]HPO90930.1 rhamnulokinase family protein [Victivallales bacterium]